jgi:hypothetical protein
MLRTRVLLATLLLCASAAAPAFADVVTDWNEVLLDAVRADSTAPPRAARAMAMVHVAVYDAVNGIAQTHEPYHVDDAAPDGASAQAAAAAAAHAVLVTVFPAQAETFNAALDASLADIADGQAKDDGIAWGESVAAAVIALRANDGSTDVVTYTPGTDPGEWQPTPPAMAAAALPQWPDVTPFAMSSGSQFRMGGPPALDSAEYTAAFNEVKEMGSATSTTRTAEQSEIAQFWVNGPGTSTPPGHWNTIAQIISADEGNTLEENARLFALLNIALADAAIVSWDNKYHYNDWRPVTAIRAADTDGNDQTEADPEWSSFIPTPPFPDYTSGHSTFSGAAGKVLELFYGTDELPFDCPSDALPGIIRSFETCSAAADESGKSRVYGGIHWEFSNQDGLRSGRDLGEYVVATYLKEQPRHSGGRLCGAFGLGNAAATLMLLMCLRLRGRRSS